MESLIIPFITVALAEMGDRTQLIALVLAARYRKPWPVLAGIFVATLASQLLGALVGRFLGNNLTPFIVDLVVGIGLVAMAAWSLKPDTLGDGITTQKRGAFLATLVTFFFAELGDKTQIATAALAAKYPSLPLVVIGATAGLMLASGPVVFLGQAFEKKLPLRAIRFGAAALFAGLGIFFLAQAYARWRGVG